MKKTIQNYFSAEFACASSKSKNKASEQSNKKPIVASNKEQLYLHFGQKSFGATEHCKKCNLLLVKSNLEDVKRHEKHCKLVRNIHLRLFHSVDCSFYCRKPSLLQITQGQTIQSFEGHKIVSGSSFDASKIIEVTTSQKKHQKFISAIVTLVENELGNCEDLVSSQTFVFLSFLRLLSHMCS